ncbi:MAG: hypothetical protein ACI4XG_07900, partial [Bradyrhizobium sp.]
PGTGGRIMLKLLLKKQLTEIFRNYFYDPKKNRARSKAGIIGYILLFVMISAARWPAAMSRSSTPTTS